jgi:hypothetical protein
MRHVLALIGPVLLVVLAAGCQFNAQGLPAHDTAAGDWGALDLGPAPADLTKDSDVPLDGAALSDVKSLSDTPSSSDVNPPDSVAPPDSMLPPDSGPAVVPVDKTSLGQAFFAATVPCVDKAGQAQGTNTKIADSASVSYFSGSVTMAGAPSDTKTWVGSQPTVTVLYNLNACDDEYPGKTEWGSAGLLIRKASLDTSGKLLLQKSVTVKDINLIDVLSDGSFQSSTDFAKPDDSQLPTIMPQLVNPVGKAKQLIVQLGLK